MTNNKQQTAVDKLETQIEKLRFQGVTEWQCGYQKALNEVLFLLKQSKEMEKERMKGMYVEGSFAKKRYYDGLEYIDAEQYYNETYGGGEQ